MEGNERERERGNERLQTFHFIIQKLIEKIYQLYYKYFMVSRYTLILIENGDKILIFLCKGKLCKGNKVNNKLGKRDLDLFICCNPGFN
jgi:hypothetical protein